MPRRPPSEYEKAEAAKRAERAKLYWPALDKKRAEIVEEFMDDWTPDVVLSEWLNHVDEWGVQLEQCVRIIATPQHFMGPVFRTTWWPLSELEERAEAFHSFVEQRGALPSDHAWKGECPPGANDTARMLRRVKNDPTAMGKILIAASLFHRNGRHHRQPPEAWPPRDIVQILWKWTAPSPSLDEWVSTCKDTLPVHSAFGSGVTYTRAEGFLEALAAEHARVLLNYVPVSIETIGHSPFEDDALPAGHEAQALPLKHVEDEDPS